MTRRDAAPRGQLTFGQTTKRSELLRCDAAHQSLIDSIRPRQRSVPDASGPPAPTEVATNATRKCPDCAETVLADAKVCKHCGYRFAASAPDAPQELAPPGKSTKEKCHQCQ